MLCDDTDKYRIISRETIYPKYDNMVGNFLGVSYDDPWQLQMPFQADACIYGARRCVISKVLEVVHRLAKKAFSLQWLHHSSFSSSSPSYRDSE